MAASSQPPHPLVVAFVASVLFIAIWTPSTSELGASAMRTRVVGTRTAVGRPVFARNPPVASRRPCRVWAEEGGAEEELIAAEGFGRRGKAPGKKKKNKGQRVVREIMIFSFFYSSLWERLVEG
eukprot:1323249-Amorphochlora_amoeboformis.AAC.1